MSEPKTVVTFEYGVMLNNGEVVHVPTHDASVARAAAASMAAAINRGVYPGQGPALLVSRKVETKRFEWRAAG